MTQTLVIVATITAKPGHEDVVRQALEQVVPPSRAEDGCGRYELHLDIEKAGRFVMLEEWRDSATLARHETTAHFQALVEAIGGLAEIQINKLHKIA